MKTTIHNSWLTVILILLLSFNTFAETSDADKLRLQVLKETNDTSKIKLLIRLGLLITLDQGESMKYLKEAYDLSLKNNFRIGLIYGRYYEGLVLWNNREYDNAIDKLKSAIDGLDSIDIVQPMNNSPLHIIRLLFNSAGKQQEKFQYYSEKALFYKTHGPVENSADCYHGIAGYYFYLGDYDKTIEYYMRARDVYKSFDPFGYATEGAVIGNIYLLWGNLDKAEAYLESGLKEFILINNISTIAYCYNNLGDLYVKRNDYKKAFQYYFEEKKYWPKLAPEYIAINLVSIAAVHLYLHSLDSARFYLDEAEKMQQEEKVTIVSNHGPIEINFYFYKYYLSSGNQLLALKSLKTALQEAASIKHTPLILKYTNELHSYLLKKGDTLQSFRYLEWYHFIQDSLTLLDKRARTATYEFEKQTMQKEDEIEQLETQKTTQRNYYSIGAIFLLLIIIGVFGRLRYINKTKKILNAAKKKSEELLLNILPYETAEELKRDGQAKAKRYEQVTVMFTDFKNFTQASEQMSAEELVKIIHFYFSEFDRIISRHNIEKIKIIGDSYMCAGGLPVVNDSHAVNVVSAALELQNFMATQKQERTIRGELFFELRIGIHTGHVVAGIVGTTKFSYDIWGDTVNTASRMENSGEPGKVNISGSTHKLIKDHFICTYRGKVTAKNKGEVDMYFVEGQATGLKAELIKP
jgi:adenylate cyclase